MTYLIEQALRSTITGLSFIERYGGIVRPMQYKDVGKIPVSSYLTAEQCKDPDLYKALIPDEAYKSVSYFELVGLKGPSFGGPKQNRVTVTGTMRFVSWLNLRKLGISGPYNPERFALEVIAAIKGETTFTQDSIDGVLQILDFKMGGVDPNSAFSRYSYADKEALFFDPYGFFYFDMTAVLSINSACLDSISLADPINCVGVWEAP